MKAVALIPARYAATRFPGKLMAMLGNKTIIQHTYEAVYNTKLFNDVIVVTDSPIIFNNITAVGGKALMSKQVHESGSDRIAEAAATIHADIIVNVQGDTPFAKKEPLKNLLQVFLDTAEQKVYVASLMQAITDKKDIANPNLVKVAVDRRFNALFFSRSIIPYPRNTNISTTYYEHIGVYAFRKQTLLQFTKWPITPLEDAEKIECLRYLENGIPIKMVLTDYMGVEIDTPEDLQKAEKLLQ